MAHSLLFFQNRALKFALLAGILAAAAAYILISYFLGAGYVLVTTKKIEAGAAVSRQNVALKRVPNSVISPGSLRTLNGVEGKRVSVTRFPGDQIGSELFSLAKPSLSLEDIPSNHVIISINLLDASLNSGVIKEGDVVDIIAVSESEASREVRAMTVLRRIKLLKVSKNSANFNLPERSGHYVICLAVSLQEAEHLYALEANNSFRLALEPGE